MTRWIFATFWLSLLGVWAIPALNGRRAALSTNSALAEAPVSHLIMTPIPSASVQQKVLPKFVRQSGQAGYWRLAQTAQGVWWFVSPDDRLEFLNTVTTVQPYQLARDPIGPGFVSRDWNGSAGREGDVAQWAKTTLQRVKAAGFKGLGAWCHPVFHQLDVPMTRDLNVWASLASQSRRLYSPDWTALAEAVIAKQADPLRENRSLVGYYIDNELDWGDGSVGPWAYFDKSAPEDPNRQAVMQVIQATWKTTESFNRDWKTTIKEFAELDQWPTLPHEQNEAYGRLYSAWVGKLAHDYYRITCGLIRKHDPNHLILGVRFRGDAPAEVARAARGFTDAQSINYYVSDARLDLELFQMLHEQSDQPLIVSEYSFHALDGGSGNQNTVGFAAQVPDQQARADGYKLFTARLARTPYIIGADWFQWMDEPPSGRSYDGEDVNFGVVDIDDRPYPLLTQAIGQITPRLNGMHEQSATDDLKDVYRESFATKPVARIPRLEKPIYLNGELSDWKSACKIEGIRHSQTVGLERSAIPLPNVYMGWTPQGLYMGLEVFDNDISGAPANGWWWTRDNVELWFSTRPVGSDQNVYSPYCHQFFIVPQDPSGNAGISSVVGQWHRDGDALRENLIPHPQVKCASRLLADRYVVELFIPAGALNGFDPISQPAMAFNIHIRNYQHAIDYFWSAPKEVLTQYRPRTWGTLYMDNQLAPSNPQISYVPANQ